MQPFQQPLPLQPLPLQPMGFQQGKGFGQIDPLMNLPMQALNNMPMMGMGGMPMMGFQQMKPPNPYQQNPKYNGMPAFTGNGWDW